MLVFQYNRCKFALETSRDRVITNWLARIRHGGHRFKFNFPLLGFQNYDRLKINIYRGIEQ